MVCGRVYQLLYQSHFCRAGLITPEKYVEGITGTFNYVWNSPARQFFNPIEMSYQAPFVDAATSVDPVNRWNTFISYYSYGSMLGLALDLSLRQNKLNLDDYMQLVWQSFGKNEKPYIIEDLHNALNNYAGKNFGDTFFNAFIYKSEMPDYESLLKSVGVVLKQNSDLPYFGASVLINDNLVGMIRSTPKIGSPAYKANLNKGDGIKSINKIPFNKTESFNSYINTLKVGDSLKVVFDRFGMEKSTTLVLGKNPDYSISLNEKEGSIPAAKILECRKDWLKVD